MKNLLFLVLLVFGFASPVYALECTPLQDVSLYMFETLWNGVKDCPEQYIGRLKEEIEKLESKIRQMEFNEMKYKRVSIYLDCIQTARIASVNPRNFCVY